MSFSVEQLYTNQGVTDLDALFLHHLSANAPALHRRLREARQDTVLPPLEESRLILDLAPYVEGFLANLFSITDEVDTLKEQNIRLMPLVTAKRLFVQRYALKKFTLSDVAGIASPEADELTQAVAQIIGGAFDEEIFAQKALALLDLLSTAPSLLLESQRETLARYAAWAALTPEGAQRHGRGIVFKVPQKIDFQNLVATKSVEETEGSCRHTTHHSPRFREGFSLTDGGLSRDAAYDGAHYCIWCHHQGKDSCSKGLLDKGKSKAQEHTVDIPATAPLRSFTENPHGLTLVGCPLEEKISEMNELKSKGLSLAALAVIIIDNPMVAATGHRICNDCMKACIYQKQTPVNIPGIETQIFQEVLHLPWGFEIYSLLTRWNPLNFARPLPKPDSGHKVLVAGLGPAGFTLAHHLMNDGHTVVGIDGLKIEPLPDSLSGTSFDLIKDVDILMEDLDTRVIGGFGGVAEYGITVRWNKNYLKLVRLLLERRQHFLLLDGVRLGGNLTPHQAFDLGFDHIALCLGAGKPTLFPMENHLAKGVRQASDFLMGLQLTGAYQENALSNLQMRLPVVVIGGGLTAIDTATEALAYYPRQVFKFLHRYRFLMETYGQEEVEKHWSPEDRMIAEEFLTHGQALESERHRAKEEQREPDFLSLLNQWGGITIAYRRPFMSAPSVVLNHEEVEKALEEGIQVLDNVTPLAVLLDPYRHAEFLQVQDNRGQKRDLPARTILVAAGTVPNTALSHDVPWLKKSGRTFQPLNAQGEEVDSESIANLPKPNHPAIFTHQTPDGRRISFFGDAHPSFAGNVVKAMGSAKQGYPLISQHLAQRPSTPLSRETLFAILNANLRPTVRKVKRLTPTIVEVVVHAPFAAQTFQPGQFYRLQNYTAFSPHVNETPLLMEGLALTGADVDPANGTLSLIVLEMGGSSDLCQLLKPGERVYLMGPTGTPTDIPHNKTVLLLGGGLGNAVLFSIGKALRAAGSRVLYFAGYKSPTDVFKQDDIEAAADCVIWCCDTAPGLTEGLTARRPQDRQFVGNMLEALQAYHTGIIPHSTLTLQDVDTLLVIGSDRLMAAVAEASRHGLKDALPQCHTFMASINSPMQCMMKEICAQCLQTHVDPVTGKTTTVFSCVNQDQPLQSVNFSTLQDRLSQNQLQEKLGALWIRHCLESRALT